MGRSAVVVGAGIGGLAAARGLMLLGWRVSVYEQAPAIAAVGAGLALTPNAVRAMDWLGLGATLRERGGLHGVAGIRTASGRWLVRLDAERLIERFGAPTHALHRAELHRILLNGLGTVPLYTGHRAVAVTAGGREASVTFDTAGGQVTETADLVVAADGVHSSVRSALFPTHAGASYGGYVCWRGVISADAVARIGVDAMETETWGRGLRFGVITLDDGRIYWFGGERTREGAYAGDDMARVAARFDGWHAPIPALLAATPPEALLRNDIYYLKASLPEFVHGRVALLGDAAHAVTPDIGQGAALSIEDAVELAAALAADSSIDGGLQAYDRRRRPRTQKMARLSGRVGSALAGRTALTAGVRDLIAAALPSEVLLRGFDGAFSWSPPIPPINSAQANEA